MANDAPLYGGDAPTWPSDDPRWPQDGPKMEQDGPRWAQDGPKRARDGPKMGLRWVEHRPKGPLKMEIEKWRPSLNSFDTVRLAWGLSRGLIWAS